MGDKFSAMLGLRFQGDMSYDHLDLKLGEDDESIDRVVRS